MAVSPTFYMTKCNEAVVGTGNQVFQPHLNSKGTIESTQVFSDVGELMRCDPVLVSNFASAFEKVVAKWTGLGYRVVVPPVARWELTATGSFDYADEPWDPLRHKICVTCIPYKDVVECVADIVPVNELSPTNVSILGAQDATTLEQDTYTKGNTLLIQGKNCKITATNTDEGVWIRLASGTEVKMTVSASTSSTIDCTCNDAALVAGEATLVIRSRDGKSKDYMVVEVTKAITIKVAA